MSLEALAWKTKFFVLSTYSFNYLKTKKIFEKSFYLPYILGNYFRFFMQIKFCKWESGTLSCSEGKNLKISLEYHPRGH